MPLQSVLPAIHTGLSGLSPSSPALLIQAATATGKSKLLPSELARQTAGRVLVLAPSTIDVADMYSKATVPCSYQCGGGKRGGDPRSSRIHLVSVGLAVKQAAKLVHEGFCASSFFDPFLSFSSTRSTRLATIPPTRGFSNVRCLLHAQGYLLLFRGPFWPARLPAMPSLLSSGVAYCCLLYSPAPRRLLSAGGFAWCEGGGGGLGCL